MSKPGLIMLMDGRAPMPRREIQKRKGGKKKNNVGKTKNQTDIEGRKEEMARAEGLPFSLIPFESLRCWQTR